MAALGVASGTAAAATPPPKEPEAERRDQVSVTERPFTIDHRASFRFRPELVIGGDLGPGASGVPAPLETTPINGGGDASTLGWASIRLRYEPVLRLGSAWEIHVGLDALSNLVLGSTHVNAGGDFAEGLWRGDQGSPSAGINAFRDALEVRHLYGLWRLFDLLELSGGRMVEDFGLGILRNDGACADCDFGTVVDAAKVAATVGGIRVEGKWEFTASGVTTAVPGFEGQPLDLGAQDDVTTFTVRVGSAPVTVADKEDRERLLDAERGVAVDWGVFSAFTDQTFSSVLQPDATDEVDATCSVIARTSGDAIALPWQCYHLTRRNAFFWRPSLWSRLEWHPDFSKRFRAEIELSALVGDVGNLQGDPALGDTNKDFVGFGGALEVEYQTERLSTGLDVGFATGDDRRYLGYLDGQNIVALDDGDYESNTNVSTNQTVTSFWFNRDYRLDLILFRQVIGGVTNAVYVKPWVAYDLLDMEDAKLTARLDVLYAAPVKPAGSPGQGDHYGVEVDGHLAMTWPGGFELAVSAGVLLPLDALRDRETGATPDPAFALRGLLSWSY